MDFISNQTAAVLALSILGAMVVFHTLVVAGVLPTNIVMGGRVDDSAQVRKMEIGAIVMTLVAGLVFALRWRSIASGSPSLILAIAIWAITGLFALNTVGNLFAKTIVERATMTPLTLLLVLAGLRLALEQVPA